MTRCRWILCGLLLAAGRGWAQDGHTYHGDPIPPELEAAYVRGLNYLMRSQGSDGNWSGQQSGPGITGLALLAILAHGDDPNYGPYAATCRRAVDAILKSQTAGNGYMGSSMYQHGFATLALAEAYGAVNDPRIGPALKKAVDLILTSQAQNRQGGWRYTPTADDADTTVSGAQLVALLAARNAGLAIPDQAIEKGLAFYRACQSADGGIGYTGKESGNGPRTAIGTLVAALAKRKDSRLFAGAWNFLQSHGEQDAGQYYFYYLYYAAQAWFQADMSVWRDWNAANLQRLFSVQGAAGGWEGPYGDAFTTATALLSMALNYRFLPIYER
ncbi:MAG: terpene cyclase/mutase family protein [Kiritimatiellaeota bacterium]|nr:terpene cyclase/mutase family protein [Kiritimatiellota bacterium]